MTLEELNAIDPRLLFEKTKKGPDYCARAEVNFGDSGRLSVYTSEGYVDPPELGKRFDVGFLCGEGLTEVIWYIAEELPALLDALKVDLPDPGT